MFAFTTVPYEGLSDIFEGYDALPCTHLCRERLSVPLANEIGVGKESVVLEAMKEPELGMEIPKVRLSSSTGKSVTVSHSSNVIAVISVTASTCTLDNAARLAAKREADVINKLYPERICSQAY
jgi:RIO kinase 2